MREQHNTLVCVIDDDDSVRESISLLLGTLGLRVRAYRDCHDYVSDAESGLADCLILDVRLPGINGLEFQSEFAGQIGDLPVIFISGHGDIPMAVRAMRQGALDFLQKPFSEQALIDRVQQAIVLSAERRSRKVSRAVIQARLDLLTAREREVFDRMVAGKISKVIGDELGISARTVEQHRARVMEKMRAGSIAELFRMLSDLETPSPLRRITDKDSN